MQALNQKNEIPTWLSDDTKSEMSNLRTAYATLISLRRQLAAQQLDLANAAGTSYLSHESFLDKRNLQIQTAKKIDGEAQLEVDHKLADLKYTRSVVELLTR